MKFEKFPWLKQGLVLCGVLLSWGAGAQVNYPEAVPSIGGRIETYRWTDPSFCNAENGSLVGSAYSNSTLTGFSTIPSVLVQVGAKTSAKWVVPIPAGVTRVGVGAQSQSWGDTVMAISYDGLTPPGSQASYLGFSWLLFPQINSSASLPAGYVYPTNTSFTTVAEAWFMNFTSTGSGIGNPMVLNELSVTALVKDAAMFKQWLQQKEGICGGSGTPTPTPTTFTLTRSGEYDSASRSYVIQGNKAISPSTCFYTGGLVGTMTAVDSTRVRVPVPSGATGTFGVQCTSGVESASLSLSVPAGGSLSLVPVGIALNAQGQYAVAGATAYRVMVQGGTAAPSCTATDSSNQSVTSLAVAAGSFASTYLADGTTPDVSANQVGRTLTVACSEGDKSGQLVLQLTAGQSDPGLKSWLRTEYTAGTVAAGATEARKLIKVTFTPSNAEKIATPSTAKFWVGAEFNAYGWTTTRQLLLKSEAGAWRTMDGSIDLIGAPVAKTASSFAVPVTVDVSLDELTESQLATVKVKLFGAYLVGGQLKTFTTPVLDCSSGTSCVVNELSR